MASEPLLSVSDFIALTNQTLEYAYPAVYIEGEVSSFKINQGKFVFFDLKDDGGKLSCFMMLYEMRVPLKDGMRIVVVGQPKLRATGYFSITVKAVRLVGEGTIKKSFELLKAKLENEGLFAPERKRALPAVPSYVAVVTSTEAAGYTDFVTILEKRWGGLRVEVAHVQVQGDPAPDQIIRAIRHFNSLDELPEVLVIVRGGGSADDLATFNDEPLVRAIAESRIPTLVGVGHEVDVTLADLAADVRAATPTNAAEILVPDRREVIRQVRQQTAALGYQVVQAADRYSQQVQEDLAAMYRRTREKLDDAFERLATLRLVISQVDPQNILRRGYALVRGARKPGESIEIETFTEIIKAEVRDVTTK